MSYCEFLIVGAMKAGTTTLYRDIQEHPDLFLPEQKEPEILCNLSNDKDRLQAYKRLMQPAKAGQFRGEASTAYTKLPDYPEVADIALRLFGPNLKIIYLQREPVARAISHYRHEFVGGVESRDIDTALADSLCYANYGRYDWQIDQWVKAFGESAVLRLSFDDYIANRTAVARQVCAHIGVDPELLPEVPDQEVHNSSSDKYAETGMRRLFLHSTLFQVWLKPYIPLSVRLKFKKVILNKAKKSEKIVTSSTEKLLRERIYANLNRVNDR